MKIVHMEDFIHPDAGYQVNVLAKLQVEQGHEVYIVTAEMEKVPAYLTSFFGKDNLEEKDRRFHKTTGAKIIRVPLLGWYSGRAIFYPRLFKVVDGLAPDILFVHGEDTVTGIQFIIRSIWQKYPMILDCHMLEMGSENRFRKVFRFIYRSFITPIIIKKNIPLIRVVDSDFVQKCLGLPLNRTILLSFGTDTNLFSPSQEVRRAFRERHGIGEEDFVVVYAGKLDVQKGGQFLTESIKKNMVTQNGRKIRFMIVGEAVGSYGKAVEQALTESENEILRFPTQPYYDLAQFYQAADMAIFPKQCSLSFFDVQSCGLPVVMEENEINFGRVKNNNGLLFKALDSEDFREKILKIADMDTNEYSDLKESARNYVMNNFDYTGIARQFTKVLVDKFNDFQAKRNGY